MREENGALLLVNRIKVVEFTSHALVKIQVLKDHGVEVSKELVEAVVRAPDYLESGYGERYVAQRGLDPHRVLRVVYEEIHDGALVVTLYPGRRSRYEKNEI